MLIYFKLVNLSSHYLTVFSTGWLGKWWVDWRCSCEGDSWRSRSNRRSWGWFISLMLLLIRFHLSMRLSDIWPFYHVWLGWPFVVLMFCFSPTHTQKLIEASSFAKHMAYFICISFQEEILLPLSESFSILLVEGLMWANIFISKHHYFTCTNCKFHLMETFAIFS